MQKTERLTNQDDPTTVNKEATDRRKFSEEEIKRLEKHLEKALCRTQLRLAGVSLAILCAVGVLMWGLSYTWLADLRTTVAEESVKRKATDEQLGSISGQAARQDQVANLKEKITHMEGTVNAMEGMVRELRSQQTDLRATVNMVSATASALGRDISQEREARDRLVDAMVQQKEAMEKLDIKLMNK